VKFLDEYRDERLCRQLVEKIHKAASRRWTLMEVCGGQTHGLLRFGIDRLLEQSVRLIHGPGCPVCVTPAEAIDRAIELARRPEIILTSFGDMLRVPGSRESLLRARSEGADVRIVYSPLDAVTIAEREASRQVVFFAVGFETTAPATAIAIQQAAARGCRNFWVLPAHVRVEPGMEVLAAAPDRQLEGFLAAGHVCTITGFRHYQRIADQYRLPIVVTGFEPADLLYGILTCIHQLEAGASEVVNGYQRSSASEGNEAARRLMEEVFQPCDQGWRGLGVIPGGGFELRDVWKRFDAARWCGGGLAAASSPIGEEGETERAGSPRCRSGEVLTGTLRPPECEHFGTCCTPQQPLGAPMVSHEGACAAYFHYRPPACIQE
jgi:hydrogenase expression/formation protein HypD